MRTRLAEESHPCVWLLPSGNEPPVLTTGRLHLLEHCEGPPAPGTGTISRRQSQCFGVSPKGFGAAARQAEESRLCYVSAHSGFLEITRQKELQAERCQAPSPALRESWGLPWRRLGMAVLRKKMGRDMTGPFRSPFGASLDKSRFCV